MKINRRESIYLAGAAVVQAFLQEIMLADDVTVPHIATNTYPWGTFAKRAGRGFVLHSDALLADIAKTGIVGYEPIIESSAELAGLGERLRKHGLEMRSIYVNCVRWQYAEATSFTFILVPARRPFRVWAAA